ncbi:MAG TPA: Ig domain-containing protein [Thermodesulfobacteriota bacterium]|nr:Ig domain-containing protein [Thermodesulfobacteriota bacterium]
MKTFSLAALFCSCLLFTTSCSYGEDLEKDVLPKKKDNISSASKSSTTGDGALVDDDIEIDEQLLAQNVTEVDLSFPETKSITIETITSEDGIKTLEVAVVLKKGDVSNFEITYRWLHNNEEIEGELENSIPWLDEYKKGDIITVNVIPANTDLEVSFVTEAEFVIPNQPPVITSEPPAEIIGEKKFFEYQVETEDPDGDEVEISLKKAPKGMKIEPATGLIEWDYTEVKPGSEFNIEILATDTDGGSYTQTITLTIPSGEDGQEGELEQAREDEGQLNEDEVDAEEEPDEDLQEDFIEEETEDTEDADTEEF